MNKEWELRFPTFQLGKDYIDPSLKTYRVIDYVRHWWIELRNVIHSTMHMIDVAIVVASVQLDFKNERERAAIL